jgi:hypothetical protein
MNTNNQLVEVVIVTYSLDHQRCVDLIHSIRQQGFISKNIQINIVVNDTPDVYDRFTHSVQGIENIKTFIGSDFDIQPTRGWLSQQWIKLAVAKNIKTPWYIIIDSDQKMWPGHSIELTDWYQDARACYKPVTLEALEQSDYHWFAEYYKNAAKFWNIRIDKYANTLLSETPPVMMHTESVVDMLAHCDKSLILERLTHEFGLYWTYLIKQDLVEKLYAPILDINKKHQLIHERV